MTSAPLRLLLVEDSEDDAFLLVRHLKKGGYELTNLRVQTAADMRVALKNQAWDTIS